ncbi:uncharacterized protein MONBRDRAFT_37430 [Monosiga brevicollis MX1]|uniref:Uncharacterized protein n=1 Tax=Monosiga brevicollis TaxID=81824 RepID=A9V1P5_MONBE|nr:uncharacterized protein MONBRDRAFT_37430 [Monosiga brevicollis MX1]EDQ88479.1 predicted protein [Monosiga brevicollis MX1]|eukprot:XP_001746583.1 hypothetical protein [Monosiga brevicollis MX1]
MAASHPHLQGASDLQRMAVPPMEGNDEDDDESFPMFPFPDKACIPDTAWNAGPRRESAFISAVYHISRAAREFKLAMWAVRTDSGKKLRTSIPLGPGDSRFRGLDPTTADQLERFSLSPDEDSIFALCRTRYPPDGRALQRNITGLVCKVPTRDKSDNNGEVIIAQRYLQTWAFLTRLAANLRPCLASLRAQYAGQEGHVLGPPPTPGPEGQSDNEASELLYYAEMMITTTYAHLRQRRHLPSVSSIMPRKGATQNRVLTMIYRTLAALLDWFDEDNPVICEPEENGTSGHRPALIWTKLADDIKSWEQMRRMRTAVDFGVTVRELKAYRACVAQGLVAAKPISASALAFFEREDLSDEEDEVTVPMNASPLQPGARERRRSRAKRRSSMSSRAKSCFLYSPRLFSYDDCSSGFFEDSEDQDDDDSFRKAILASIESVRRVEEADRRKADEERRREAAMTLREQDLRRQAEDLKRQAEAQKRSAELRELFDAMKKMQQTTQKAFQQTMQQTVQQTMQQTMQQAFQQAMQQQQIMQQTFQQTMQQTMQQLQMTIQQAVLLRNK